MTTPDSNLNSQRSISVMLCTHNPREDYLDRTLQGLQSQTLSKDSWELLIIDNKSDSSLEFQLDLSWHPLARVVREEELGIAQARLTGIREAKGELVVFVDDDNVLVPNYLENALRIASNWPQLGSWSGRVVPEFEVAPADYLRPHLWRICIREITSDQWGNTGEFHTMPWGAGMCIRQEVLKKYYDESLNKPDIPGFSRRGRQFLASGEDVHIAKVGLDMGYGCGVFCSLELTHLIPKRRVDPKYLLQLIEDTTAGECFLNKRLDKNPRNEGRMDKWLRIYKKWRASSFDRAIANAIEKGQSKGRHFQEKNCSNLICFFG
jgi:glycosyltransferase involved in cell wall biosynthesis